MMKVLPLGFKLLIIVLCVSGDPPFVITESGTISIAYIYISVLDGFYGV